MLIPQVFVDQATMIFSLTFLTFCVAMLLTPVYTFFAYRHKFWIQQRTAAVTGDKLPVFRKLYADKFKRQTPTMAGMIMVVAISVVTLLFNLDRRQTLLPLLALIGGGIVGLIDDIINVRGLGGGIKGLRSPIKFAMITLIAAIAAWFFFTKLGYTSVYIPFFGDLVLGWLLVPLFVLVVVSTGNAVNISDGLDGLSGGLLVSAYGAFGLIAALQGNYGIATFCFSVVGALLAYLWFNIYPARFIMGDVGSFALGTALGVVAMLTDTLLLLPVIGLVFVAEAGSSLLQIFSKKVFKRKIFLSAPFHHHLGAIGWPEVKVTMRLWVIGQVCAAIGLWLALAGGTIR